MFRISIPRKAPARGTYARFWWVKCSVLLPLNGKSAGSGDIVISSKIDIKHHGPSK